jgi:DNA polymerase-3 subunit delta
VGELAALTRGFTRTPRGSLSWRDMARKSSTKPELTEATRVALLIGREPFLHAEYVGQLRAALEAAHGAVDTLRFDGEQAELAEVLDECRTLGLMQQHKLVVVDRAEQLVKEDNRPLMERYAAAPASGATLVLRAERWYPGKLDKLIEAAGAVVKFQEVSPAAAAAWAIRRAEKEHRAQLQPDAAELLVDRIGTELGRLDSELAKLALCAAVGDCPSPITRALVAEMVGATREEEAWAVQESLLTGSAAEGIARVRAILDHSRKDAAVPLSWACMDLARKVLGASRGLREGRNPFEIGGKLKIWPDWKRDAVIAAARRADPARARELLAAAVETDRRFKSGLGDADRALEVLAQRFSGVLGA